MLAGDGVPHVRAQPIQIVQGIVAGADRSVRHQNDVSVAIPQQRLGWIGSATWVALETASDERVQVKSLAIESQRTVGKALLTLLRAPAAPQ